MTAESPVPLSALDLVEGFHLSAALAALEETGVLASLAHAMAPKELASRHGLDADLLAAVLTWLAGRTDLIEQRADEFVATERFDPEARFLIHQYLGAYGPGAVALADVLRHPLKAPGFVDPVRHAMAFRQANGSEPSVLAEVISALDLDHLLDLGCGSGSLLVKLGTRCPDFVGWGVDVNPSMCDAARNALIREGLADRIHIIEADCRNLQTLPPDLPLQVRAVSAANLLNNFIGSDGRGAIALLSELKQIFPGRILIVADYYGRVGKVPPPWPRHVALQDFVQAISGQGIPPPDFDSWNGLYQAAGCALAHVCEIDHASAFVHILKL